MCRHGLIESFVINQAISFIQTVNKTWIYSKTLGENSVKFYQKQEIEVECLS